MKWPIYKINDICKVSGGKRLPKGHQFVDSKTKHPYIRITDMSFDSLSTDGLLYITEETFKHISRYTISKDDIYISIAGTIGYVGKIPEFIDGANLTENCAKLSEFSDEINRDYLLYYLRSPRGNGELLVRKGGASQPKLALERIKTVPVPVPPINIQSRIANILSAYDDLIQNNQKQIKLLEEAAMRLYTEWFVNLRFPGHENTKIVDGVPEGWSLKKLIDIADITMGQSPKSEYYNDRQQGLPFHQGVTNYGYRFVIDETYSTSYTRIAEAGSILFSVRAPVGRINITKNKIVIGRGLAAINHREGLQSFLFYMLKNRFYKDDLIGNGAIYASITKSALHSQEFLIPSDDLANKFNSVAKSIDQQITNADQQIILLKQARDRLLPRLLSGEIEV
ncbi:restriction endonuclease subunit S [Acetoanaerobium noterae]|uniref:restriction endonuclease subunit S n=1 Tax=Acetoanaerobium noterae TaxID=745369 RepID=UPI0028AD8535|nr:restriction endonuclease subunit S [Acetoanaerobium noterae]